MKNLPPQVKNLIERFAKLPSVGPKTAEKFVFYLIKQPKSALQEMANDLISLHNAIKICSSCNNVSTTDICHICADVNRNNQQLCIVANPQDLTAIENTKAFKGKYFVLGGTIKPGENFSPEDLNIKGLMQNIKGNQIKEIIFGFNPDLEGEATMLYLTEVLKPHNIKQTRLAKGLPTGSVIEYADEITLSQALKGRTSL